MSRTHPQWWESPSLPGGRKQPPGTTWPRSLAQIAGISAGHCTTNIWLSPDRHMCAAKRNAHSGMFDLPPEVRSAPWSQAGPIFGISATHRASGAVPATFANVVPKNDHEVSIILGLSINGSRVPEGTSCHPEYRVLPRLPIVGLGLALPMS